MGDTSVRIVARPTETNSGAAVLVRGSDPDDSLGYIAAVLHSEQFGGSVVVAGIGHSKNRQEFFPSINGKNVFSLPFDVRANMTELQIDVIGDEINVWAWLAGNEMPAEPLFTATDSTYAEPGFVRLAAPIVNRKLDSGGAATFRSVHVADMAIHKLRKRSFAAFGLITMCLLGIAVHRYRHQQ